MQLQSQSARAFYVALQTAFKTMASKNSMAILDHVLLTQHPDGRFFFTAATENSQLTIPAPFTVVEGKYTTPIAFTPKDVVSYLSKLPDCCIQMTINDLRTVDMHYVLGSDNSVKSGKVSFPCVDGSDFPLFLRNDDADNTHIALPSEVFAYAIGTMDKFTASDELRPVMNTLLLDVAEDMSTCTLVSSNGHKFAKYTHTNNLATGGSDFFRGGKPSRVMVDKAYFKTLSVFAGMEQDIDILATSHYIQFTAGDVEVLCKSVEGKYPNYNSVIPQSLPHFVCIDKKEIINVVERVRIFGSDASQCIKVEKDGMFLNVSAQNIDLSTSATDQVLISEQQCPDHFAIGFKADNLIECLNAISGDTIRMALTAPDRPCVMTPNTASPNILTLLMPMLL